MAVQSKNHSSTGTNEIANILQNKIFKNGLGVKRDQLTPPARNLWEYLQRYCWSWFLKTPSSTQIHLNLPGINAGDCCRHPKPKTWSASARCLRRNFPPQPPPAPLHHPLPTHSSSSQPPPRDVDDVVCDATSPPPQLLPVPGMPPVSAVHPPPPHPHPHLPLNPLLTTAHTPPPPIFLSVPERCSQCLWWCNLLVFTPTPPRLFSSPRGGLEHHHQTAAARED